ncbi:MAG: AEC family transporter [Gammaproteobacteria bacterium]|jgi:malonate transporter and related proteins|uniref:AEC family transporter n=1 Tax=Marinomonas TaxID=28253 RepID=UPI000C1F28F0|nr:MULTISPECIES: AEC family transporter [unclassified Marinomonas]MBU1295582.1 AEC family transporter [Gammaproteobacteria bacterium]MBU1464872.1 AEC family transporter [Gammaproteobacteria bacterium]MBU2023947.1 AEC family transporter [Gammaproteobacteria bacterium]MBU2240272.1 AEC family transporter [Gammaproteobacteria bacterium]MBU2318696.1 AEC family transporter [Gammaproteobacteria bacterium]|tara:strand:- start:562 stop:1494 length:933 start_codon:yes stop_codon:yes gene_type:complete
MEAVISIIAPIFFLILIGFLSIRYSFLPQAAIPGLSRFVLYLALPALIFIKLSSMELKEVLHFDYLAVYAASGLATFFITVLLSWRLLKSGLVDAGVRGVGATMSNSAFIGFPVLLQFFDYPLTQAFVMSLMVENIILLPVCLIFIETVLGKSESNGKSLFMVVLKRISTNPLLIALVAGLVFSVFELSLPSFIGKGFNLLAAAASSVALIVIGGSLVGVTIKGQWAPILLVAIGKLVLFPVIVTLLLLLTPTMPNELKIAVVIFASVSMFSSYPIVCGEYGSRSFCASTLLITTVLSFFTLSVLLRFFV